MIKRYFRELLLFTVTIVLAALVISFKENEELRTLAVFAFYLAVSVIYELDSRYPIAAAIVLLISAAIFLPKDENLANRLAVYAYYFLVVGVSLQLVEYMRESRRTYEDEERRGLKGHYVAVASGKGGVGKTTIATNLAAAFAKLGRRCLLVDLDLPMPTVDIAMGIDFEKGLKDALLDDIGIKECVYEVGGVHVIPTAPVFEFFENRDKVRKLKSLLDEIKEEYEIILLDLPPGSNIEILDQFAGISLIIVANPDKASLVNSYSIKVLAQERGCKIAGLVLNRVEGYVDVADLERNLEMPIIAVLPEDKSVRGSFSQGVPIVLEDEEKEFSREVLDLAKYLLKALGE